MLGFLFESRENKNQEKATKVDEISSRAEMLEMLGATPQEWDAFQSYRRLTPIQRTLEDLNYSDDYISLLLQANTYWVSKKKELNFEFTSAEDFFAEAEKALSTVYTRPNRFTFVKMLYLVYGVYHAKIHGTKEEKFSELAMNGEVPVEEAYTVGADPMPTESSSKTAIVATPVKNTKKRKKSRRDKVMTVTVD